VIPVAFSTTVQIPSVQPNNKKRVVPKWQSRPQPFFPLTFYRAFHLGYIVSFFVAFYLACIFDILSGIYSDIQQKI
jgi:hypothetical protein